MNGHLKRLAPWLAAVSGSAIGALLMLRMPAERLFVPPAEIPSVSLASGERYACPMLCVIQDHPGSCPVCGMQTAKVEAGAIGREHQHRMGLETTRVIQAHAKRTVVAFGTADYDHRHTRVMIARVPGRITRRHEPTFGCCSTVTEGAPVIDVYSPEVIAAQGELQAAIRSGEAWRIEAVRVRFERWHLSHVAKSIEAGGAVQDEVTLVAPFGGQVWQEDVEMTNTVLEVGRAIETGDPLLRIVDPSLRVLVVAVPETESLHLREGSGVSVATDDRGALPEVVGRVDRIAAEIDRMTRTREVRIYLEGAASLISPGSLVRAEMNGVLGPDLLPANPRDHGTWGTFRMVPEEALLSTGRRTIAWRVQERTASGDLQVELAELQAGPSVEGPDGRPHRIVLAGLEAGDEVVARGAFLVDSQAQLAGKRSLLLPAGARRPEATTR